MREKMRLILPALTLMLTLVLCCAQPVRAASVETESGEGTQTSEETKYTVTISFDKNGGTGNMPQQVVTSGTDTKLNKNTFKKTGYTFSNWATKKNGKGTKYADEADVTELANESNDNQTITLYAQWKITAPEITKLKSTSPGEIKVTYKKNTKAKGYQIQYSTDKKFKKDAKKVTVKKNTTSTTLMSLTPNKKYYVRTRSYTISNKKNVYGEWSNAKSTKTKKGSSIENVKSDCSIEADVKLTGKGTGYHAKLVLCTATSAVSFGLQYDKYASGRYAGKTMALIENVASNAKGGQKYTRPGNKSLKRGETYHLMLMVKKGGKGSVYLDYKKIGSFKNKNLYKSGTIYSRIEACGRLNNDKVDATFYNVKCKWNGKFNPKKTWGEGTKLGWTPFNQNKGLKYEANQKEAYFRLYGTVKGAKGDWDKDYEGVSQIIQFQQ